MKFNPLLLAITLFVMIAFIPFQVLGQKVKTKDNKSINTLYEHDHRKCGIDAVTDRLAKINPDYAKEVAEFKNNIIPAFAKKEFNRSAAPIINIPVVVHVIHNGEAVGTGANISDGQIQAQLDILNLDFSATNSNYNDTPAQWQDSVGNPEVQFCLAIIDPNGNATTGITRNNIAVTGTDSNDSNIEDEIKPAVAWNSNEYYNIFVVGIPGTTAGGGVTGYAYYPTTGIIGSVLDGSVVDYRWFGGPGFGQSGYGTLTHETGHYLGLPHPFDGEDCAADDNISDTPNVDAPTSDYNPGLNCSPGSFPTGPISCGNEHMYVNFMDYVNDDDCSTSFSNNQINVMRAVLEGTTPPPPFNYGSRLPLANNATTVCSFFDDDAGISSITDPTSNICGNGQVTPIVTLQNFGINNLTTVTISYQINGGTPVDFIWIDVLGTGETQNVSLAPFTPPGGDYTFTVYTTLPNGSTDGQTSNDQSAVTVNNVTPTNIPLLEGFEDAQWDPTSNGIYQMNVSGDIFEWERSTAASGFGVGTASTVFNNFASSGGQNPNNTTDALITSVYDFSMVTGASLSFDVAYAPYDASFFDSLKVYASTDCGSTFSELLFSDGNLGLATADATTGLFTPASNEWETHTIDLSAYNNNANLTISFLNVSGYGNRLFIDNINISAGCSMTVDPQGTDATCFDLCDGTASVNVNSGSAPFTYLWDANAGNSTESLVPNLCDGSYSVTVTDAANCTAETVVTIGEPAEIILNLTSSSETAVGANDGTATAGVSGGSGGGYTYLWNDPTAQITATATALAPGTYCVTVTDDNSCTVTNCTAVDAYDCGSFAVTATATDIDCNGNQNGTVSAVAENGTEPYTYLWSTTDVTAEVTDLSAGTYTLTATDANACTSQTTVTINEPDALMLAISSTAISAVNTNDGTASANPSGGTLPLTYLWNDVAAQTTETATALAPGTYCVTVTDNNDCAVEGCISVSDFNCGNFLVSLNATGITCFGGGNGMINSTVENGTGPYSYDWSNGGGTANLENLNEGVYTLTVTDDATGCTAIETTEISEPDFIMVSVSCTEETSNNANDGTCSVSVSGGTAPYTELWSNGGTGVTITGLAPGTYCVTVTDANNCTEESCGTVNEVNCNLSLNLSSENASCFEANDGTATVATTGGTDPIMINWSTGASTQSINNLAAGSYSVTVTDNQGCEVIEQFVISEPDELMVGLNSTNPTSNGAADGTATATPQGGTPGYAYNWSTGGTGQTIINLSAGIYTVTVNDNNGCTVVNEVELTDPSVDCGSFAGQTIGANVLCFGESTGSASVSVGGGTMPYEYLWNNNETTALISNLSAGTYTVTVIDANDCDLTFSVQIDEPTALSVNVNGVNPATLGGNDGSATAAGMGGVSPYVSNWSNGQTGAVLMGVPAGTYIVTVTDSNDCTAIEEVVLTDPGANCDDLTISIDLVEILCNGFENGAMIATAANGTEPYSYAWSNGVMTAVNSGIGAGVYSLTVTDAEGCTLSAEEELTEPPAIVVMSSSTAESAVGMADGTATADVSGGVMPYSYEWSNGGNTSTITNLSAGMYIVTITDANGCFSSGNVIVEIDGVDCSNFMIIDFDVTLINCFGDSDGGATAISTGGTEPIEYEWSNGSTGSTIQDLSAGIYVVTATDAQGCVTVNEIQITQPDEALDADYMETPESAPGAGDGAADVTVTGGTPPYEYDWSNGATSEDLDNLSQGVYTLTITDANGCQFELMVMISVDGIDCTDFVLDAQFEHITCNGEEDGLIVTTTSGGVQPITYNWSNGEMTQSIFDLSAGFYTLTVLDSEGCEIIETFEITEPPLLEVMITSTDETVAGNDGTATAIGTGGTGSLDYLWSNGEMTAAIDNLAPGTYEVTLTDESGCTATESVIIEAFMASCDSFEATTEFTNLECSGDNNGTASVIPTGGLLPYEYNWSTGSNNANISNLSGGTYTVTVIDANDCVLIFPITIFEPNALNVNVSSFNGACGSGGTVSATVSGGTQDYEYNWSNGGTESSISDLDNGAYSVTITDANGCTTSGEGFIENDEGTILIESEIDHLTCFGENDGAIDITLVEGTAPFVFEWNTGETSEDLSDLEEGTYSVLITDAQNCSFLSTFVVASPAEMTTSISSTPATSGNNGTATANTFGGTTPYTFQWSNGSNSATIDGLNIGTYSVIVTDANACISTASVVIGTTDVDEITDLEELLIAPNPSNGRFVLNATFSSFNEGTLEVYNILGQRVYANVFSSQDLSIDIDLIDQSAGSYFLVLRTEKGKAVRKLIIQ